MRILLVLLAGCHDYAHFSSNPGDGGCVSMQATPGCTLYTFGDGVPPALQAIDPLGAATVTPACDGLHVHLPGGASHDFWVDNHDAFRVEERQARSGDFSATARVHGVLEEVQQFSGIYGADNSRIISVQTSTDAGGLRDHDIVFSFGASGAEQSMYPDVAVAAGDDYPYGLRRSADQFTLDGGTTMMFDVTVAAALNVGVVVGNCCDAGAPAFDAVIEWLMVCQ